ncbi:MAG TPA: Tim44-like domain-containing protein [Usitatibacter sp.]|nr:Tim44-like domain-containing protein [Usitatibacter sp.]
MRTLIVSCALAIGLALAAGEADAKRFGGGGNLGKQRPAPTQNQAAPAQPPAQQAAPASPATAPGAAGAAAAAKPTFMSRWGGLLAGLGIGVLLASLFGAELGPIVGLILAGLLAVTVIAMLFRFLGARRAQPATASAASGAAPGFSGIGSRAQPASTEFRGSGATDAPAAAAGAATAPAHQPSFEKDAFLRVAKTSFIRLQAANDTGDLDDIRDFTTPEVYSEVAMQLKERGAGTQRTEVVDLHAELVETVVEGDYEIASVRFYGLLRENDARSPEPFDETWHVRKDRRDRRASWLIAGIQQAA